MRFVEFERTGEGPVWVAAEQVVAVEEYTLVNSDVTHAAIRTVDGSYHLVVGSPDNVVNDLTGVSVRLAMSGRRRFGR